MGYYYVDQIFADLCTRLRQAEIEGVIAFRIWNKFQLYFNNIRTELNNYPTGLIPSEVKYSTDINKNIVITIRFNTSLYDHSIEFIFYKDGTCSFCSSEHDQDLQLLSLNPELRRRAWVEFAELNLTTSKETENFKGTPDELYAC